MNFYIENIIAYFRIIRPVNIFLGVVPVLITADILNTGINNYNVLYSILTVGFFMSGGNIVNDIFDLPTDLINRPRRPLPAGNIRLIYAVLYAVICFLAGILTCLQLNFLSRIIGLAAVFPVLILYTPLLKKIPLIGNMMIGVMLGMVFIFAEAAMTNTVQKMWIPASLAFGLTLLRELEKDMEDIQVDIATGITTFTTKFGIASSFFLYFFLSVILCAGAILHYFTGFY